MHTCGYLEAPTSGPSRHPAVKEMFTRAASASDASFTVMPRALHARRLKLLVGVYLAVILVLVVGVSVVVVPVVVV